MRELKYFATYGLIGLGIYYGLFENMERPKNLLLFVIWFVSIVSFFTYSDKFIEEYKKKRKTPPAVPEWLDRTIDFTIAGCLAYFGYYVTSVMWILHIGNSEILKDKLKEDKQCTEQEQ